LTSFIDLTFEPNLLGGRKERRYVAHIHKFNLERVGEAYFWIIFM